MHPAISIFTLTLGRPFYLNRMPESVIRAARSYQGRLEHHVCFQGCEPGASTSALIAANDAPNLHWEERLWPENLGIARGVNRIVPELTGSLLIKMDDDCLIVSDNFFEHVAAVAELVPAALFSPYPVGLIDNPGGAPALEHRVVYSQATDTHYTLRRVEHLGGLCRVAPADLVREWTLQTDLSPSGTEDSQYARNCIALGIEMFYLENALIVEHQESSLGQRARGGESLAGKDGVRSTYRSPGAVRRALTGVERALLKRLRSLPR